MTKPRFDPSNPIKYLRDIIQYVGNGNQLSNKAVKRLLNFIREHSNSDDYHVAFLKLVVKAGRTLYFSGRVNNPEVLDILVGHAKNSIIRIPNKMHGEKYKRNFTEWDNLDFQDEKVFRRIIRLKSHLENNLGLLYFERVQTHALSGSDIIHHCYDALDCLDTAIETNRSLYPYPLPMIENEKQHVHFNDLLYEIFSYQSKRKILRYMARNVGWDRKGLDDLIDEYESHFSELIHSENLASQHLPFSQEINLYSTFIRGWYTLAGVGEKIIDLRVAQGMNVQLSILRRIYNCYSNAIQDLHNLLHHGDDTKTTWTKELIEMHARAGIALYNIMIYNSRTIAQNESLAMKAILHFRTYLDNQHHLDDNKFYNIVTSKYQKIINFNGNPELRYVFSDLQAVGSPILKYDNTVSFDSAGQLVPVKKR